MVRTAARPVKMVRSVRLEKLEDEAALSQVYRPLCAFGKQTIAGTVGRRSSRFARVSTQPSDVRYALQAYLVEPIAIKSALSQT